MAISIGEGGIEALRRLTSAEPPLYLSPSPDLSQSAREASQHIFSSLKPYTPKSPFDQLLTDGFDAEQIWQQIDLQSQPLISNLRREVLKLEKNPGEIAKLFGGVDKETRVMNEEKDDVVEEREGSDELCGLEDDDIEEFDDDDDAVEEEEEEGEGREDGEAEEEDGSDEDGGGVVEDKFLKIKELNRYLEKEQKREYENDEKAEEDEEEDDELGIFGADMDDDEGEDEMGNARYEDFFAPEKNKDQKNEKTFGSKRNNGQKRKPKLDDGSEDFSDDSKEHDNQAVDNQMKHNLSTHEKELQKLQSKIEQMERSNLEPKTWTMQGEVTAAKRPKNSALEVDLDFEHNVRPAPVITEEVTASLEELIKKRILEGQFDDVQRAPSLQSKAPKEHKELDENKSKKGLAEIYEDEYVQKTGLVSTALTFSDEQKKEATMLFKKLCLKLDALSHFHFTPKPVVEDMSINTNVPALAMEEVAPLAVSDAAMLAPEEVYAGKGDIKDETELTQAERKRRRANKKRKYKAQTVKRTALKKARESTTQNHIDGKAE